MNAFQQIKEASLQQTLERMKCLNHNKRADYFCLDDECLNSGKWNLCDMCLKQSTKPHNSRHKSSMYSHQLSEDIQELIHNQEKLLSASLHENSEVLHQIEEFYDNLQREILKLLANSKNQMRNSLSEGNNVASCYELKEKVDKFMENAKSDNLDLIKHLKEYRLIDNEYFSLQTKLNDMSNNCPAQRNKESEEKRLVSEVECMKEKMSKLIETSSSVYWKKGEKPMEETKEEYTHASQNTVEKIKMPVSKELSTDDQLIYKDIERSGVRDDDKIFGELEKDCENIRLVKLVLDVENISDTGLIELSKSLHALTQITSLSLEFRNCSCKNRDSVETSFNQLKPKIREFYIFI